MENRVMLQVPVNDVEDLSTLLRNSDQSREEVSTVQAFDGDTYAQALYFLTPSAVSTLIAWLQARAASRKHYKVVISGEVFSGYTAAEVSRIIEKLKGLDDG